MAGKARAESKKLGVLDGGISSRTLLAADHDPTVAIVSLTEQVRSLHDELAALRAEMAQLRRGQASETAAASATPPLTIESEPLLEPEAATLPEHVLEASLTEDWTPVAGFEEPPTAADPIPALFETAEPEAATAPAGDFSDFPERPVMNVWSGDEDSVDASRAEAPISNADFAPFDPDSFAEDFSNAVANPVPVPLEEPEDEAPPQVRSRLDLHVPEIKRIYLEMAKRYAPLVRDIQEFNIENPPDFVAEDDLLAELVSESPELIAAPEPATSRPEPAFALPEPPASAPGPITLSDAEMEELVREAALSEAASSESRPPFSQEPEPEAAMAWPPADPETAFAMPSGSGRPDAWSPEPEALALVSSACAAAALALPLRIEEGQLVCLVAKPFDEEAIGTLELEANMPVRREPGSISDVVGALRRAYSENTEEYARGSLLLGADASAENLWEKLKNLWAGAAA